MQKLLLSKLQHRELIHAGRRLASSPHPHPPPKRIKRFPFWSPVLLANLSWLGDSWWCLPLDVMKGREDK